jgi:hypothetical protein
MPQPRPPAELVEQYFRQAYDLGRHFDRPAVVTWVNGSARDPRLEAIMAGGSPERLRRKGTR